MLIYFSFLQLALLGDPSDMLNVSHVHLSRRHRFWDYPTIYMCHEYYYKHTSSNHNPFYFSSVLAIIASNVQAASANLSQALFQNGLNSSLVSLVALLTICCNSFLVNSPTSSSFFIFWCAGADSNHQCSAQRHQVYSLAPSPFGTPTQINLFLF